MYEEKKSKQEVATAKSEPAKPEVTTIGPAPTKPETLAKQDVPWPTATAVEPSLPAPASAEEVLAHHPQLPGGVKELIGRLLGENDTLTAALQPNSTQPAKAAK